jgi:hypothetical protein
MPLLWRSAGGHSHQDQLQPQGSQIRGQYIMPLLWRSAGGHSHQDQLQPQGSQIRGQYTSPSFCGGQSEDTPTRTNYNIRGHRSEVSIVHPPSVAVSRRTRPPGPTTTSGVTDQRSVYNAPSVKVSRRTLPSGPTTTSGVTDQRSVYIALLLWRSEDIPAIGSTTTSGSQIRGQHTDSFCRGQREDMATKTNSILLQ